MSLRPVLLPLCLGSALLLSGCRVGPDYQRPAIAVPAAWQEGWQQAQPRDGVSKGEWWTLFQDAELDRLLQQASSHNYTLKVASARLVQAQALTRLSRAALFPTLDFTARATRTQPSSNRPNNSRNASLSALIQQDYSPVFVAGYEPDLFGRIARAVESSSASEQQAQADLENARLVLTAEVATSYFSLRALDAEGEVLQQSVALQTQAVNLARSRHEDGVASGLDVLQQQALLSNTQAQLNLVTRQRKQIAHALASLLGITAGELVIASGQLPTEIPQGPTGLPADVLERRPDVAAAEREVAAANAQIGVARAAWFPSLFISASRGWQSTSTSNLLDAPSVVWSLGLNLAQSVFDGGRRRANVDFARAGHEAASAQYRQTVLQAMQEVEDGLSAASSLSDAARHSEAAVTASQQAADMVDRQYKGGLASSLELIIARMTLLENRRQLQQIRGQQLANAVLLIKSLGGGWDGHATHAAGLSTGAAVQQASTRAE